MISLQVYKPGQGVRSRIVLLVTGGITGFFCAQWLHRELIEKSTAWSYGVPAALAVIIILTGLFFANWPRMVDLLIETEAELNKVSWTSRKDLWKSTWVVIFAIAFMATFMFLVARISQVFFERINVLQSKSARQAQVTAPWPGASDRLAAAPTPRTPSQRTTGTL